ncbi:facilitated trehalose transporter Tret1-2 homolog [Chrysoperla carnea]|uniref:facilitated trehalose transporter Tret1-2 homolog n=1 Tax=Chrysoperla carnea TaxID=189513 RepID=UPI001D06B5FE|nr:facilitated trehalose transporter Tret1-2 homolog [Chrysoperla carnea]
MVNKLKFSDLFSISRKKRSKQNEIQQNTADVYWIQYVVGIIASLSMTISGLQLTWFGPALVQLKDETLSPIHVVSSSESAWINSMLQLGAVPSPFLGSFLANNIGRKNGLLLTTIPNIISCLLIFFVQNIYMLYAARFICGISVGIVFSTLPVYLSEISSPKIRGIVATIGSLTLPVGTVGQFILFPLMTIQTNSLITLILVIIQGIGTFFIPESPYFYIMKNKEKQVEKSLKILRRSDNVSNELLQLQKGWENENQIKDTSFFQIFKSKVNQRALIIISVTMVCQQMSGPLVLLGYISAIYVDSKIPISSYAGSILLIASFAIATLSNAFFIDKCGRRPLFITSTILTGICAILTGVYFFCEKLYTVEIVREYYLFLIITLTIYILSAGGLIALPYIFASELFETKYRATASSLLSVLGSILGFITIQAYEFIQDNFGREYIFWYFGLVCILGTLFSIFWLPETKGKSFSEIQAEMNKTVNNSTDKNDDTV